MSVEDAVTEGLAPPVDQNAQAAEEAKRMLAELESDAVAIVKPKDSNGVHKEEAATEAADEESNTATKKEPASKRETDDDAQDEARERRQDRRHDRYSDRGHDRGRGRGRGRGGRDNFRGGGRGRDHGDRDNYKPRNFRDNIKSDLTSQEVTDDADAIRKQVQSTYRLTLLKRAHEDL